MNRYLLPNAVPFSGAFHFVTQTLKSTLPRRITTASIALLTLMVAGNAWAGSLQFRHHLTDHMVLQREKPVSIRGAAEPGAEVTVSFAGQTRNTKADAAGAWTVTLDPMPAEADGAELVATSGGTTVKLSDVVVGDVFLFARQTSVDVSLGRDAEGQQAAQKHKKSSGLRSMHIHTIPSATPQADLAPEATEGWQVLDRDAASALSAAAYYLGRDLAADSTTPIGIIDLNLGSAFPISWLSREALEETETLYGPSDVSKQLSYFDLRLEAEKTGVPMKKQKVAPTNTVGQALFPAGGYNGVLHPLRGLTLKAALVQLGNDYPYMLYADLEKQGKQLDREALNRTYVDTYELRKTGYRMEPVTTPRIPKEWREVFGDETLPMGLVTPPGSDLHTLGMHHREMRELQRRVATDNAAVEVVLAPSANRPFSAQVADEAALAERCLQWVNGAVYQAPDTPATGPVFARLDTRFNEATIHFEEGTAEGLRAEGDALDYFEAAGVEGEYSPIEARIEGTTLQLRSDTVSRIVRVRYNWNTRPNEGLVNAAGLPALPFRTENAEYQWFVQHADDDLPEEYHTPANAWGKSDVTLINAQLQKIGYSNFTGWLGPIGVFSGPFGPNMGVREVKPGSPAEGLLFEGDIIYSANGEMLGENAWEVMARAITDSETRERNGKLVLGLRREGELLDVEVTLKVMGTYSPTAPYDCPKTENIIEDLKAWVVENGAGAGFLNTDALFLLATGDPEMQGYVRRIIYNDIIAKRDPNAAIDPKRAGKSWHNSAEAILLAEYYHATGDTQVLPYLKHACDRLSATENDQYGGWRHNYPGGPTYGLIPNAGLPGVMGMALAQDAGVDINLDSFRLNLNHFSKGKAETGFLIYGFGECTRWVPTPFDPEKMYTGHLDTFNGGLSAAGILMGMVDNHRAAHLCSLISAFAWNNTFHGHGGNFWNNFWTPLGAHQHGKPAFVNFWEHHRWYRELNRMYDGSLIQHAGGDKRGAGCGVALVAPRRRIQIVGAPVSPFSLEAPEILQPALAAYARKDYGGCVAEVEKLQRDGFVPKEHLATVEYLAQQARDIQASITHDLARMQAFVDAGQPSEAGKDLMQLAAILPEGDSRLVAMREAIGTAKPTQVARGKEDRKTSSDEVPRKWARLVKEDPEASDSRSKTPAVVAQPEQPNVWQMKVVESLSQAPKDWTESGFDAAEWQTTTLPISWPLNHTALFRTTFEVEDKNDYDLLRLYAWVFRQQAIEIHLNGKTIGKINNIEKKTGDIESEFKQSALRHLKNGENTLAISTRQNWRWGMLFMKVYNDGFDFNLDARLKP